MRNKISIIHNSDPLIVNLIVNLSLQVEFQTSDKEDIYYACDEMEYEMCLHILHQG